MVWISSSYVFLFEMGFLNSQVKPTRQQDELLGISCTTGPGHRHYVNSWPYLSFFQCNTKLKHTWMTWLRGNVVPETIHCDPNTPELHFKLSLVTNIHRCRVSQWCGVSQQDRSPQFTCRLLRKNGMSNNLLPCPLRDECWCQICLTPGSLALKFASIGNLPWLL